VLQHTHRTEQPSPAAMRILAQDPARIALFLDVDGTLLEIAPTPDGVVVPDGLSDILARVAKALDGAVAILTGRQLSEIDQLLTPLRLAGSGVHGSEMRAAPGEPIESDSDVVPQALIDELHEHAREWPGVLIEPKGPGLAIHYRQALDLKPVLAAQLQESLERHRNGDGGDLVLCGGRKLFEIVPSGHSKGTALTTIAALPHFQGRMPVMIGDDVGDESAFAAAERLGGAGLKVGGEHFSHADCDFSGPAGVRDWLEMLATRISD